MSRYKTNNLLGIVLMMLAMLLFVMAAIALVAHYAFAAAFARAEVSALAPFEYTALVWATIIGYAVWHDIPSAEVWMGAAIIIVCGLYVMHRESLRHRARECLENSANADFEQQARG